MTKLSQHYHIYSTGIELNIVSSPHGVLHVVPVKGDEEAEDGEEHDGVGCENETTRSSCDLQSKLSHWAQSLSSLRWLTTVVVVVMLGAVVVVVVSGGGVVGVTVTGALDRTIGRAKAEMTMPVVTK